MNIRFTVFVALGTLAQVGLAATTAVAPFHNATGRAELDALCYGLPELVSAALATSTNVAVVDRACLDAVIAEQGLSFAGSDAAAAGVKLGRLVRADTILAGSFTENDDRLRVTVQVIDVKSAAILRSIVREGAPSNLVVVCEGIASDVVGAAGGDPVHLDGLELDASPIANLHVMRGLHDY